MVSWAMEVSLSGDLSGSQEIGVILWEGRSPVFCLMCPHNRGILEQSTGYIQLEYPPSG